MKSVFELDMKKGEGAYRQQVDNMTLEQLVRTLITDDGQGKRKKLQALDRLLREWKNDNS